MAEIAVIGGGPAGLMAAEVLAGAGRHVTVYDRMPSVGRKFLMAGRGGLNLTHSEPAERFVARYREAAGALAPMLAIFGPADLRAWADGLGEPTFIGSSGRVFPAGFKASPLLRAWLRRLDGLGVRLALRHRWAGWQDGGLRFQTPEGERMVAADAAVLALGGASWPRLGADGGWTRVLAAAGIPVAPLRPANCGFAVAWSDRFRERFAGQPVKPLAASVDGEPARGELVITQAGLEGGAVYAHAAALRQALERTGRAALVLDLAPDRSADSLAQRLAAGRGSRSLSTHLHRAAGLSPVAAGLLREATPELGGLPPAALAARIKALPVAVTAPFPIARAISTAGGLPFAALDHRLMLRARPGTFAAGEMLDWEAPTGGYLLQACFSTGVAAAKGALAWLAERDGLAAP